MVPKWANSVRKLCTGKPSVVFFSTLFALGAIGAWRWSHRVGPLGWRLIGKQQRGQGLLHGSLQVVGQHAQEQVGLHPPLQVVVDGLTSNSPSFKCRKACST